MSIGPGEKRKIKDLAKDLVQSPSYQLTKWSWLNTEQKNVLYNNLITIVRRSDPDLATKMELNPEEGKKVLQEKVSTHWSQMTRG